MSEFASQQRIREDLQVAIAGSEHALSLAQARLALRRQRPGKEQCYDPAQSQLFAEVQQLTAHINKYVEIQWNTYSKKFNDASVEKYMLVYKGFNQEI